jgi:hypothetical protein
LVIFNNLALCGGQESKPDCNLSKVLTSGEELTWQEGKLSPSELAAFLVDCECSMNVSKRKEREGKDEG